MDDDDFDGKYIALEGESDTRVYEVRELKSKVRDAVGVLFGHDPRGLGPDTDYVLDLGLTDSEMGVFAAYLNTGILQHYDDMPDSEVLMWRTLHDTVASIARLVADAELANARPEYHEGFAGFEMKEEYAIFDDGRRKNYKTRIYHVPHVVRDVKGIVSKRKGIPLDEISLEMDYRHELGFGAKIWYAYGMNAMICWQGAGEGYLSVP